MRTFFVGSVCAPGEDYCEENYDRIINQKGFVLHSTTLQKGTFFNIKIDDIIILKYNNHFIAYGKVNKIDIGKGEGWNHWAYVDEWIFYNNENKKQGVYKYGIGWSTIGGGQMGTVKTVTTKFGIEKTKAINSKSTLFQEIEKENKTKLEMEEVLEKINILKFKKQIILQGPPGTGKTRLAKIMAEKMTQPEKKTSPIQLIDTFFRDFIATDAMINHCKETTRLLDEFANKFKIDELRNLSLENYALGREDKDGFCYWLEYILTATGKYTGRADKGKIYYDKVNDKYVKSGFLKSTEDDQEAMKEMSLLLDKVVNEKFDEGVDFPIGKGFILKILNTYYPNKYFPINSEHCLDNALKLFGVSSSGMNYIEKNKKLQSLFEAKKNEFDNIEVENYEFMYFLFNNFNLKKEVKLEGNELLVEGKYKIIQFHPAYSYEDFVRGITAKTNKNGDVYYNVENRILAEFANEALDNPKSDYVLIIDEINRANLPTVLGELIYALEYRYKYEKNNEKEASVESIYDISKDEDEADRTLILPENLYIIGTMNTADRSVGHIDYAIRRRFAFIDVLPKIIENEDFQSETFKKVSSLFVKNLDSYFQDSETVLEPSEYLSKEFDPKDVWLGHSYFISNSDDFDMKLEYEIKPILREYVKDGILKQSKEIETFISSL